LYFYIPRVLWENNGILKFTVNFSENAFFRKGIQEEKVF